MINHSRVSRKDVGEDRIAICSVFGCEFLKRVKPLKFRFLGFGKYPKCKKHGIPLVYIDDHIGQFIDSALACLYDKAGLPSKDLVSLLKVKYPEEMVSFVQGWVYCMSTGRGAPALSRYLDSISKAYMKNLKRKQVKALKYEISDKWEYQALRMGRKELGTQYARFLKHLRIYEEVLIDVNKLKPLSGPLRDDLKEWQDDIIKNYSLKNKSINTDRMTLIEIKQYYDQILNIGTCRCLIGLDPEVKTLNLTAFDKFSVYVDFFLEKITEKFTKNDLEKLENYAASKDEFLDKRIRMIHNENHKSVEIKFYKIRKGDNLDAKLVKHLFNIIYNLESKIVELEKTSKNLNLRITKDLNVYRFKDRIVASEISKILGISLDMAKRWSNQLESSRKTPLKIKVRPTSFKRICDHMEILSTQSAIYNPFLKVLAEYREKKYNNNFLNKMITIFNNYIRGGGGQSWLSQILGKSRAYISDLEHRRGERGEGGPEHYAKYFNFLTYIHILEQENLDFKEGMNIRDLKAECRDLIFKEMSDRNMMEELRDSKYSRRIVNTDNRELFDIVIHSLVALTLIERAKENNKNNDFVYDYIDLSRLISRTDSRDFLNGKFRKGYILAKTEGLRLIKEIRKGFFKAPKECHDVIYRIKIHINNPHWREYDKHFIDLRTIQHKELLDINLGMNIYDKDFIRDAHLFVAKDGQIIDGRYVFYVTRHHLDEDKKYFFIFKCNLTDYMFKIVLLPSKSHWNVHANKEDFHRITLLLNERMKHLYRLLNLNASERNYAKIIQSEFFSKTITIDGVEVKIWNNFPKNIIYEWIKRWKVFRKVSSKEFYKNNYPNFYKHKYEPQLKDMELYSQKSSLCKKPEFWYWYFGFYEKQNIYPKLISQDL